MSSVVRQKPVLAWACGVLSILVPVCLQAKNLVWTGSVNGNWDTSTKNWVEVGSTTPVAFAKGDNVTITNGPVTVSANVEPGVIVFDVAANAVFSNSAGITAATRVEKRGAGMLLLRGSTGKNTFVAPVHVYGGSVKVDVPHDTHFLGNSSSASTVLHVWDGGELWYGERNAGGGATADASYQIQVHTGGVFSVRKAAGVSTGNATIGTLWFDGGTFDAYSGGNTDFGFAKICHKLAFTGPSAYVVTNYNDRSYHFNMSDLRSTEVYVADITGDDSPDVTLYTPFARMISPSYYKADARVGFTKTGPGRLRFADRCAQYRLPAGHDLNGDVFVKEGELEYAAQGSVDNVARNIHVNTNASLRFSVRNTINVATGTLAAPTVTVDHATFTLEDPAVNSTFILGPLVLDHANFVYTNAAGFGGSSFGAFTLGTYLKLLDDQPICWSTNGMKRPSAAHVHLCSKPYTIIDVPDITQSSASDFRISTKIMNHPLACDVNSSVTNWGSAGFVKTGAGTLQLENKDNSFSGYTEIREGTVLLDRDDYSATTFGGGGSTYLGSMTTAGRQIVVSTNGTLHIAQRNIFTSMLAAGVPSLTNTELIVRGGTLICSNDSPSVVVGSGIGNLTFDDAKFVYFKGNGPWGFWQLNGTFKFLGTRPYDFPVWSTPENQNVNVVPGVTSTFDVADITGDGTVDVSMELGVVQPNATDRGPYKYGFTKKGAGTLRFAQPNYNASLLLNGTNVVAEGTLQVDSLWSLTKSLLTQVQAGGYLSGTGKVTNVEIATGGGFAATAGRKKPLLVTGLMTLPAVGTVDFICPDGVDPKTFREPVAQLSGASASFDGATDFSDWTMTLNGEAPPYAGFGLYRQGDTLFAAYASGTVLILR